MTFDNDNNEYQSLKRSSNSSSVDHSFQHVYDIQPDAFLCCVLYVGNYEWHFTTILIFHILCQLAKFYSA